MYPENTQPTENAQPTENIQPVQPPVASQPVDAGPYPPAAPPAPRSRRPLFIVIAAVVALVLIGGVTVAVLRANNVGPFKDSGLAACEAIRDSKNQIAKKNEKVTQADYQKLRKVFADSRYADIRDSGTKFTDLVWQLQGMDTNADGAFGMALAFLGQVMQSYSSLSGACAAHGVVIPPLSMK